MKYSIFCNFLKNIFADLTIIGLSFCCKTEIVPTWALIRYCLWPLNCMEAMESTGTVASVGFILRDQKVFSLKVDTHNENELFVFFQFLQFPIWRKCQLFRFPRRRSLWSRNPEQWTGALRPMSNASATTNSWIDCLPTSPSAEHTCIRTSRVLTSNSKFLCFLSQVFELKHLQRFP